MNPLDRSILKSLGDDNGWENLLEAREDSLLLGSSRHPHSIDLIALDIGWQLVIRDPALDRSVRHILKITQSDSITVGTSAELGRLLYQFAQLAMALPTHPLELFNKALREQGIPDGAGATEAHRTAKVRIGQDIYRECQLRYWGGACAVTGLALPALLRASHAKPWAHSSTDAERLEVFNGFLLAVHLDALFDQGFLTFDANGQGIVSPALTEEQLLRLGITATPRLRWVEPAHEYYLTWHREHVFRK
ncbi:MAG: HNH endonuclease [Fibrobacteria bacterium]|nr:HNH endonuclease [Fibrobacteria bacterium]